MDVNQLISHSRSRFDHAQSKRLLKEKYQAKLMFAYKGGMFCASPDLLILLSLYPGQDLVLQDLYDTPIRVNVDQLQTLAQQRWQEQMNAWLTEHEQLNQNR